MKERDILIAEFMLHDWTPVGVRGKRSYTQETGLLSPNGGLILRYRKPALKVATLGKTNSPRETRVLRSFDDLTLPALRAMRMRLHEWIADQAEKHRMKELEATT